MAKPQIIRPTKQKLYSTIEVGPTLSSKLAEFKDKDVSEFLGIDVDISIVLNAVTEHEIVSIVSPVKDKHSYDVNEISTHL